MGRKDQSPAVSSEAQAAAQTALQKLNLLSVQATYGTTTDGLALLDSLIPPGPDESPEIRLDEKAIATLSPRERFAFTFTNSWAKRFGNNFGFDRQSPPETFAQLYQENIGPFAVALARTVQGILSPTGEFGLSVIENMIQTNESYRALIGRVNSPSKQTV